MLDYARFLSALDRGVIIPKSLVETMKSDRLGFDSAFDGRAGSYAWKNGGCPDFEGQGRTCKTVAMTFPGDVQVYVAVNSDTSGYTDTMRSPSATRSMPRSAEAAFHGRRALHSSQAGLVTVCY